MPANQAVVKQSFPSANDGLSIIARILPSRNWRIAIASIVVAILLPASRLFLLLILGVCFLTIGPAARWAKKNRLALVILLFAVPVTVMTAGYLLEQAQQIDFTVLQPGTGYVGYGVGKYPNDPLEVTASVAEDGSVSLAVTYQNESRGRPDVTEAIETLPGIIASTRTLQVDAISGATFTTDGIREATHEALTQAGGAGEQPFYVEALQWLTKGEFSREMLFQLGIIFGVIFLMDFMLAGVIVRNTGESLNCYNCQACVGVCPVGRVEDDVPLPMTMVLETRLGNYARVEELAKYCVGCAKCAARCPNGISPVSVAGRAISAKRSIFRGKHIAG
jgi:ferredoxin